ncbi:peptidase inhibitor clitocypin domain-containing protein [Ceratobasidium sp. AG-Ba]|nr:peptidase inhibitor clitocypin domain-containing protein [Ceratobasidium sp. AG-Ba]QRW09299.1 peptidase inhibitor clitocypin domain-containing protein [Ceratobasidium sp. AG-Ba]
MSELPFGTTVTLRYVADLPKTMLGMQEIGGVYATAQDASNHVVEVAAASVGDYQKWQLVSKDRGVTIQFSSEWGPIQDVPSAGVGAAWHHCPEISGSLLMLSGLKDASTYYVNVVVKIGGGWLITISPMGTLVGLDYYVSVSNDSKLIMVGPPNEQEAAFSGWFVQESN